jgi:hypothetical protein
MEIPIWRESTVNQRSIPESGFALVAVLLFRALAATIVTPFILDARTERMVQSGLYRTKQLDLLADGLTDLVAAQILSGQSRQEKSAIPLNAEGVSCAAGRLTIALHIQPVGSTSMPPRPL